MTQLRDDPFCHGNEFVGFSFLSPHLTGITVTLNRYRSRIVTSSFGAAGLTELEDVFKPTASASWDLSGMLGASLEGESLISWRMHDDHHPRDEWSIVEAWHMAGADHAPRAQSRAWRATLREELLFVATRPRSCRALEALLPSTSQHLEHWRQKWQIDGRPTFGTAADMMPQVQGFRSAAGSQGLVVGTGPSAEPSNSRCCKGSSQRWGRRN